MATGNGPVRIFLRPQPKSHPFTERECMIDEKMKVGRSVAKSKPSSNNLVFDCKVLSRNHAVIWATDGQVFVRDTKSSNGTFINNARLSATGEESVDTLLKDGDIIQFGVDVMENQRQKVTHGCIIALFVNPSARAPSPPPELASGIRLSEITELAQLLMDCRHRQEVVDNKLSSVQFDLEQTASSFHHECKGFIEEEQMLARIDTLENQLQFYTLDQGSSDVQRLLKQLEEEKTKTSTKAKESLQSMLQEKMEILKKYSTLQLDYDHSEQECDRWKAMHDELQAERRQLAQALDERDRELHKQCAELKTLRHQHSVLEQEHGPMKQQHQEMLEKLDHASVELVNLAEQKKYATDRLCSLQEQMELLHDRNISLSALYDASSEQVRLRDIEIEELRTQLRHVQQSPSPLSRPSEEHAICGVEEVIGRDPVTVVAVSKMRESPHSRFTSLLHSQDGTLTQDTQPNNVAQTTATDDATADATAVVDPDPMATLSDAMLSQTNLSTLHNSHNGDEIGHKSSIKQPEIKQADVRAVMATALLSAVFAIVYSFYAVPGIL